MQKRKSFPERQFLVYNAEIFFVNSYNPWAWVVKRTKLNSKKSVKMGHPTIYFICLIFDNLFFYKKLTRNNIHLFDICVVLMTSFDTILIFADHFWEKADLEPHSFVWYLLTTFDTCLIFEWHNLTNFDISFWYLLNTFEKKLFRNHIHFSAGEPGQDGVISGMRKTAGV